MSGIAESMSRLSAEIAAGRQKRQVLQNELRHAAAARRSVVTGWRRAFAADIADARKAWARGNAGSATLADPPELALPQWKAAQECVVRESVKIAPVEETGFAAHAEGSAEECALAGAEGMVAVDAAAEPVQSPDPQGVGDE